jgi:hypothetical protein
MVPWPETCGRYTHHAQQTPPQYELYTFRESLVPKEYVPAAFRRA